MINAMKDFNEKISAFFKLPNLESGITIPDSNPDYDDEIKRMSENLTSYFRQKILVEITNTCIDAGVRLIADIDTAKGCYTFDVNNDEAIEEIASAMGEVRLFLIAGTTFRKYDISAKPGYRLKDVQRIENAIRKLDLSDPDPKNFEMSFRRIFGMLKFSELSECFLRINGEEIVEIDDIPTDDDLETDNWLVRKMIKNAELVTNRGGGGKDFPPSNVFQFIKNGAVNTEAHTAMKIYAYVVSYNRSGRPHKDQ